MDELTTGVLEVPEGMCSICHNEAELTADVAYPFVWARRKICIACKDRLVAALKRALAEVGWEE